MENIVGYTVVAEKAEPPVRVIIDHRAALPLVGGFALGTGDGQQARD